MRLRRLEVDTIRRLCEVPKPLTVTGWADKYRMLPETSTSPGPFRSDVVPYARRWMDLMADPSVSLVVMCWAAQTIKSTCIENAIGYRIDRQPTPLIVVQPKIDAAEGWAKERLVPMILATPKLRDRVRLGRATDSTLRYKRFPGGFLFVASAQSATELASRSSPFVLCDEVDRYEMIPGEGNPVEIVAKRAGAADIGTLVLTSTPRDAESTIIWPYLEGGTFEKYEVPCEHCAHLQPLEWASLRWDKHRPATAHYVCRDCAGVIDHRAKREMLAAGQWIATNPEGTYPSSHLNALYSPFDKTSWASLAAKWDQVQGKPADLQVFVNTNLAELWQESSDAMDGNALLAEGRLDHYEDGVVPCGVGLLTAGVDIQQNRIEVRVWGWGAALESWLVAKVVLPGDPQQEPDAPGSVWRALDEVLQRRFPHEVGPALPISATFIDSGHATTQVYRFTKRRAGRRVFACKGQGGAGVPLVGKPSVQTKERVVLYMVGVDTAYTAFLRSELPTPLPGPGFVHLPDWIESEEADQMTSMKRTRRVHKGQVIYEWRRKTPDTANEGAVCRNYARGALEMLGARTIAQLGAMAERAAAVAVTGAAPEAQPPAGVVVPPAAIRSPVARRGGWVNGWRK